MILPADKGRATVIMPKGQYYEKAHKLCEDAKTYQQLSKDPTSKYTACLTKLLQGIQKEGEISWEHPQTIPLDHRCNQVLWPTQGSQKRGASPPDRRL